MNLYELTKEFNELMEDELDYRDDLTEDEIEYYDEYIEAKIKDIANQIEQKVGNISRLILNLNAYQKAIADEIKRLSFRRNSVSRKIDRLKLYIKENMQNIGLDKVTDGTNTIRVCKNGGRLPILIYGNTIDVAEKNNLINPEHLPEDLLIKSYKVDGSKIYIRSEKGEELPKGITFGNCGTHIRVS